MCSLQEVTWAIFGKHLPPAQDKKQAGVFVVFYTSALRSPFYALLEIAPVIGMDRPTWSLIFKFGDAPSPFATLSRRMSSELSRVLLALLSRAPSSSLWRSHALMLKCKSTPNPFPEVLDDKSANRGRGVRCSQHMVMRFLSEMMCRVCPTWTDFFHQMVVNVCFLIDRPTAHIAICGIHRRPPKTLLVSILASFLSGSVNGGLAILAVSYTKTWNSPLGWRVKVVGFITSVLFTISALFLQCWTYTVQMLWGYYNGYPIAAYVTVEFTFHFILFMIPLRRRASNALTGFCNAKRLLHCAALSYLSAKIGALQPLTNDSRLKDELGKAVYWYNLLLASAAQLCLYVGVLLLSLDGPPHLRWSSVCPTNLSISPPDEVMGFPCSWYVPAIIVGMLMYCFTIASHIVMDNHVNKRAAKDWSVSIYPDHGSEEAGDTDLESTSQIDHNSTSMIRESQIVESTVAPIDSIETSDTINGAHRVYIDDDGDNKVEGLEKGCFCPVLSTTPEEGKGELESAA